VARAQPLETVGTFHGLLREMQSVEPRLNSILANWYDASAGHYIGRWRPRFDCMCVCVCSVVCRGASDVCDVCVKKCVVVSSCVCS
jgi:hypothetical protein